jgi:GGDEF domain-containing protein
VRDVAARLRAVLPVDAYLTRIRTAEFVAFHTVHGWDHAIALGRELRNATVARPVHGPDGSVDVSLSVGIAIATLADDARSVLHAANTAMIEARLGGAGVFAAGR